ncbi:hypothetical protein [Acinetobacter modestus]
MVSLLTEYGQFIDMIMVDFFTSIVVDFFTLYGQFIDRTWSVY